MSRGKGPSGEGHADDPADNHATLETYPGPTGSRLGVISSRARPERKYDWVPTPA